MNVRSLMGRARSSRRWRAARCCWCQRSRPLTLGSARRCRSPGKLQLYSLAVPTEKSGLTTSTIVMTVPAGFGIDSFVPPPPGWQMQLQQTGSGDSAVVTKVTWTGGRTPTGEDSLFQFLAQPASAKTYTFQVEQTYSDGSIVNWAGAESSEAPAPTIEVASSLGRRRRVAADDHRADRRGARAAGGRVRADRRGRGADAGVSWRRGIVLAVGRHAGLGCASERGVGACVPRQDGPGGERRAGRTAAEHPAYVRRGGRAAAGDHLGDRCRRAPGDDGARAPVAGQPGHAGGSAAVTSARGVVPDLLARDLGGRPSRRGGVHLRGRAESRTGAAVPGSEHLGHRDHATVAGRAVGDVRAR